MNNPQMENADQAPGVLAQWVVLCLSAPTGDDAFQFAEEARAPTRLVSPWRILVVDDDAEVHEAMDLALGGVSIHGRPLRVEHCHSAATARARLATAEADIDLVLLDVVMETVDAGLDLLEEIRALPLTRDIPVLLHTGQPGQAPEVAVRGRYDISGYLTKSNVTRPVLIAALESALLGGKLSQPE